MKITVENVIEQWPNIKSQMPQNAVEFFESTNEFFDLYNDLDKDSQDGIDDFLEIVNAALEQPKPAPAPATDPEPAKAVKKAEPKAEKKKEPKKEPKKKEPKKKEPKAKKTTEPKPEPTDKPEVHKKVAVGYTCVEIGIIRAYLNLHGQSFNSKYQAKIYKLLKRLQEFIVSKAIRKSSPYAKEIMDIQESLLKAANSRSDSALTIEIAQYNHYKKLSDEANATPMGIIKNFLTLVGKNANDKIRSTGKATYADRAKAIIELIKVTEPGEYAAELQSITSTLKKFIDGKTDTVTIPSTQLNGLRGLAGCR